MLAAMLVLMALAGCAEDRGTGASGASATVILRGPSVQIQALGVSKGTFDEVTDVVVDVFDGQTLLASVTLVKTASAWAGTFADLPFGFTLTFVGHAMNSTEEEIFTGSTDQVLAAGVNTVAIEMAAVDDGIAIGFPGITQITFPATVEVSGTVDVLVSVEGGLGETLNFEFIAPGGGGTFSPVSGQVTISPKGGALIVSAYTAPTSTGTFGQTIRLTNSLGNSIEATFDAVVIAERVDVTLDAVHRGWWDDNGNHTASNNNTFTGALSNGKILNSYFIFDLSAVTGVVEYAMLRIEVERYFSTDLLEDLSIWDVGTDPVTLEADGTGNVAVFDDLQSGLTYGSFTVFAADEGKVLVIALNFQAVADLDAATGKFAIGLHGTTIVNRASDEGVRFSQFSEARIHQLVLTVAQ